MFRKFLPISGYYFSLFFFIGDGGKETLSVTMLLFPQRKMQTITKVICN